MADTNQLTKGLIAIAALVLIVGGVALINGSDDDSTDTAETSTSQQAEDDAAETDTTDGSDTTGADQDDGQTGSFTAEGQYTSPGGNETISVNITLEDDIITAVTVTPEADNATSLRFQENFAGAIADEVVGTLIEEVAIDNLAGSSLTGTGFNDALEAIRRQG